MSTVVADVVAGYAAGQLAAQRYLQALRDDKLTPSHALGQLRLVQIEWGSESSAVEGFLAEIAKRAR